MRKILFRSKIIPDKKWAYGFYLMSNNHHYIFSNGMGFNEIDPDTVGEYSNYTDKYGRKIFEGDIVEMDNFTPKEYIVSYIDGAFCLADSNDKDAYRADIYYVTHGGKNHAKIIGNIYDNPKLYK